MAKAKPTLAAHLYARAFENDLMLRYVYDRLDGLPHASVTTQRDENVQVTLRWADGSVASVSGGTSTEAVAAIDGESRVLPPLQPWPRVTLADIADELGAAGVRRATGGGGDDPTAE